MKTIILFITLALLSACNGSQSKESNDPFSTVSWQTEKLNPYLLVRPIDYEENATDVYHLPIRKGQWYLIYKGTECYLLPVYTDGQPGFIENATRWNKIAIIDTMIPTLIASSKNFDGLSLISKMEVVCFKDGYQVEPTTTALQQLTVIARKK